MAKIIALLLLLFYDSDFFLPRAHAQRGKVIGSVVVIVIIVVVHKKLPNLDLYAS